MPTFTIDDISYCYSYLWEKSIHIFFFLIKCFVIIALYLPYLVSIILIKCLTLQIKIFFLTNSSTDLVKNVYVLFSFTGNESSACQIMSSFVTVQPHQKLRQGKLQETMRSAGLTELR